MLVLPDEINKILAVSGNDVTKYGKKYFEQDRVKIKNVEYISENDYSVTTSVEDNYVYTTQILKKDGKISYSCECEISKKRNTPCKHIIATLFDLYIYSKKYIEFKNDISISSFEDNNLLNKRNYSGNNFMYKLLYSDKLIKYYENIELGKNKNKGDLKIIPKLEISGFNYSVMSVSFKIGRNRMYVIKDIYEFGHNFLDKRKERYGKELELVHDIKEFEESDRELVSFIMSKTNEYFNFAKQDNYFSLDRLFRGKLNLYYSSLDEFFNIFKDKSLKISEYYYTDEIKFIEEDPIFSFTVSEKNNLIEIGNNIEDDFYVYDGQKYKYVLYKDKFYRCSEKYSLNIIPILKEFLNNRSNKIDIPIEYATSLCEYVLPNMKTYIDVECKSEFVNKYRAESLATKIYLDIDTSGSIIAEVKFCYLDKEFNPFLNQNDMKFNRNKLQEQKVKEILDNNHFKLNTKDGTLYISNDEHIYDFLENGINTFMERFEVLVTDKFKSKNIINPKNVQMGLRVKNDLLEIEIDDLGFDEKELSNIIKSYRQKKKFYRLKDGSFVNIDSSGIDTLVNITDSIGIEEKDIVKRKLVVPKYRAVYLNEVLDLSDDINIKKESSFKDVVRNMSYSKELDFSIPENMDKILRQYQRIGYNWLMTLDSLRIWWNTC